MNDVDPGIFTVFINVLQNKNSFKFSRSNPTKPVASLPLPYYYPGDKVLANRSWGHRFESQGLMNFVLTRGPDSVSFNHWGFEE